jgi:hypothetical protein
VMNNRAKDGVVTFSNINFRQELKWIFLIIFNSDNLETRLIYTQ